MADIVEFRENGVPIYPRTHKDAVVGLDEALKDLKPDANLPELWTGQAKQGNMMALKLNGERYRFLMFEVNFNGLHRFLVPTGQSASLAVTTTVQVESSSNVCIMRFDISQMSIPAPNANQATYVCNLSKEVFGASTGVGTGVTGYISKVYGVK